MARAAIETRRAYPRDADAIALAHLDSIRSIGPAFYPPDVVEAWASNLTPDLYVKAMEGGEAFFIATADIDGQLMVLGFSTHRVDDAQDGASVYVRGRATRQGIGTALLRLAEEHARAQGATSIHIQASLAGVDFYEANGFHEIDRGEAHLMSGRSMPCVFMRKLLGEGPSADVKEMIEIRSEGAGDIGAIREVNRRAFGQDQEADIVDALRVNGGALLSLVATRRGRIVGHIMYSPLRVGSATGAALGPMAVVPEQQGRGIGTKLVEAGNEHLARRRCPFIVVIGHPKFYPRFGFRSARSYGITCEWDVPDDAFMALVLDETQMTGAVGAAVYRPEFTAVG